MSPWCRKMTLGAFGVGGGAVGFGERARVPAVASVGAELFKVYMAACLAMNFYLILIYLPSRFLTASRNAWRAGLVSPSRCRMYRVVMMGSLHGIRARFGF